MIVQNSISDEMLQYSDAYIICTVSGTCIDCRMEGDPTNLLAAVADAIVNVANALRKDGVGVEEAVSIVSDMLKDMAACHAKQAEVKLALEAEKSRQRDRRDLNETTATRTH